LIPQYDGDYPAQSSAYCCTGLSERLWRSGRECANNKPPDHDAVQKWIRKRLIRTPFVEHETSNLEIAVVDSKQVPISIRAVAVLLGYIGFLGITQLLGKFDDKLFVHVLTESTPSELVLAVLRLLAIPTIIFAAIGLWEGRPWALRLYWITVVLILSMVAVKEVSLKLAGSERSWAAVLLGTLLCACFYGAVGFAIRGSMQRQSS
jgi:hypothetical protein